jgi:hypothetical protein
VGKAKNGLYANGKPARPTTERMFKAFEGIDLIIFTQGEQMAAILTDLEPVHERILALLGLFAQYGPKVAARSTCRQVVYNVFRSDDLDHSRGVGSRGVGLIYRWDNAAVRVIFPKTKSRRAILGGKEGSPAFEEGNRGSCFWQKANC